MLPSAAANVEISGKWLCYCWKKWKRNASGRWIQKAFDGKLLSYRCNEPLTHWFYYSTQASTHDITNPSAYYIHYSLAVPSSRDPEARFGAFRKGFVALLENIFLVVHSKPLVAQVSYFIRLSLVIRQWEMVSFRYRFGRCHRFLSLCNNSPFSYWC